MDTPNQSQKPTVYHLYAQASRTYFSYKKPGNESSYAFMYIQMHNGNITFRFSKAITQDNKVDLTCYLPAFRVNDMSNIIEGIMGRRRNAFERGDSYASDEVFKIPVCSYISGKETQIGSLTIDTEMVDGTPRLRLTYLETEKKDSVSIVFNDRIPASEITATSKLDKIDYYDLGAYDFAVTLKSLQDPLTPFIYRVADSAVNSITKYISSVLFKKPNKGFGNNSYSNNNNSSKSNDNVPEDYDTF